MKKLMFAVAAIAAGIAVADVTSANVVGYAQNDLCNGATMVSAQFSGINDDGTFDLQSFKAIGEDCSDNVLISTLSPVGVQTATYVWINYGGESGTEELWADTNTYEAPTEPVNFQPGDALWVEATSTEQGVQSSGQVVTKDSVVQLCNGATMVGNVTPVKLALQDILATGTDCSDNVLISTLSPVGIQTATYVWINYGGESGTEELWADTNTYEAPIDPVLFNPGDGLWVEATSSDQFITIPGVEL